MREPNGTASHGRRRVPTSRHRRAARSLPIADQVLVQQALGRSPFILIGLEADSTREGLHDPVMQDGECIQEQSITDGGSRVAQSR